MNIVECIEEKPAEPNSETFPDGFGLELNTISKARRWLTNPKNWHDSELFVLKWNGLTPTISSKHGKRLVAEPWDDGLPTVVVVEQMRIRRGDVDTTRLGESEDPTC